MSDVATNPRPPASAPVSPPAASPPAASRGGRLGRAVGRRAAYGLGLVPASAGVMVAVAVSGPAGGVDAARRHLACGGFPAGPLRDERVSGARVVTHGVLGVAFGLLFWWLAWMTLVATARGPFYGFVVPGPYDDAWGGPALAGAWAAHAWVWVGVLVLVALLWWGLAGLHARLTEHVLGARRDRRVVPVGVVVVLVAVVLVWSWVHQI